VTESGTCDPLNGCGRTSSARLCNQARCLNSTTLRQEVGCANGACTTRDIPCTSGCAGDMCIIP
jgi:hypothetical protein